MFRRALHASVGVIAFLLIVRCFIAVGIIQPLAVEGSSMHPWANGVRATAACEACGRELRVGLDLLPNGDSASCPLCENGRLGIDRTDLLPADRMWVDRLAGAPNRWDTVVLRSPIDAQKLIVKRVVGLPGEVVSIAEGDVWINGHRAVKPVQVQHAMGLLEHLETDREQRWASVDGHAAWKWKGNAWHGDREQASRTAVLRYERSVSDELPANLILPKKPRKTQDLMIGLRLTASPDACCWIALGGIKAELDLRRGHVVLTGELGTSPPTTSIEHAPRTVLLTVFDRRATLVLDGSPILNAEIAGPTKSATPAVGISSGSVQLCCLTIWKDIYYEPFPNAPGAPGDQPWLLGADEYFVVGDNQAISLDSRSWQAPPGVPSRLLLGRARRFRPPVRGLP